MAFEDDWESSSLIIPTDRKLHSKDTLREDTVKAGTAQIARRELLLEIFGMMVCVVNECSNVLVATKCETKEIVGHGFAVELFFSQRD